MHLPGSLQCGCPLQRMLGCAEDLHHSSLTQACTMAMAS
jgi:hypothetical protein